MAYDKHIVWWYSTPLSTIYRIYRVGQFYWWRKTGKKPLTYHKSLINFITLLYTSPWSRFELTTSVVIGTDCIGSRKSYYHTITATTVSLSAFLQRYLYLISEMPVPSQGHYGFRIFRLLTDFVFIYLWVLTFPL